MAFEDWDKRQNGDIAFQPLAGWSIATLPLNGLVRIDYYPDDSALEALLPEAIQLGMTASQAREFAQALLRMADRIDRQPLGSPQ